jgi:hypothetical protein
MSLEVLWICLCAKFVISTIIIVALTGGPGLKRALQKCLISDPFFFHKGREGRIKGRGPFPAWHFFWLRDESLDEFDNPLHAAHAMNRVEGSKISQPSSNKSAKSRLI